MGTERKVKMKLSLKKLAQQQRGSMCQEEIGALCECLEKVGDGNINDACAREVEALSRCDAALRASKTRQRPSINYHLQRLNKYFIAFRGLKR